MTNPTHILYLEDDIPLAHLVKRKLEQQGYRIELSDNGQDCLERITHAHFDLLILDYITPGLTGLEVLKLVKTQDRLPVIMVSGNQDIQVVVDAMKLGCDDYVVKEVGDYVNLLQVSIERVFKNIQLKKSKALVEAKLINSTKNLERAQSIAKIGSWEYIPGDNVAQWSDQEYRNFGYQPGSIKPTYNHYIDIVHPDDRDLVEQFNACCLSEKKSGELVYRLLFKDGSIRYIRTITEVDIDSNDQIRRIFGISQDITKNKLLELELKQAATVFETINEAIFICNEQKMITSVNPAFTTITGFTAEQSVGKKWDLLSSDHHKADFFEEFWKILTEQSTWQGEMWYCHREGHIFPTWQSVTAIKDDREQIIQYVSVFIDISQWKEAEEMIRYQANYDSLTSLPNRNLFNDRIERAIYHARRKNKHIALMLLDLDRFKWVNDTLGHRAGDTLLKQTARRLEQAVRSSDTVARLGGDEFIVILPELEHSTDAELIAKKILAAFAEPVNIDGTEVFISASIGISIFPEDGKDAETLQKSADRAMYSAKEGGRNQFRYFTPVLKAESSRRLLLISAMRTALRKNEFQVYYQPIIDICDHKIVSAEALIRWYQPELGFISPTEFIPLAEETGLIRPIGNWVMEQVAKDMQHWMLQGLKTIDISINKSSVQFSKQDCNHDWQTIFQSYQIPLSRVTVEITETVFMENGEHHTQTLEQMRQLGISISLDDFGTGYSSLNYLKRFPIDIIKIDREFINEVTINASDALLVEMIISLAEKMKIKVVAEGVETLEQLNFLKQHGCHYIQGYYFSRPLSCEAFKHYLLEHS